MKKINAKLHYFGRWGRRVKDQLVPVDGGGWREALELYRQIGPDLHAGRRPLANKRAADPTIGDVCNDFYESKKQLLENHGITRRAFADYVRSTDLLVAAFGKGRVVEDLRPLDFRELRAALSKRFGPVRLANEIGRIKTVFKHALENRQISSQVFYGREFDKPKLRDLRLVRSTNGKSHEIKPDELRRLSYRVRRGTSLFRHHDLKNWSGDVLERAAVDNATHLSR